MGTPLNDDQLMAGQSPGDRSVFAPGVSTVWRERWLSALLLALPLSLFGELLLERTHHRPLGAATFAVAGVLGLVLCLRLTAQLYRFWLRSSARPLARLLPRLLWALGGIGLLLAITRAINGASSGMIGRLVG